MEATVRWLSQSDPVPAQSDKRCRSLNIRDVSSLHRLKAEMYRVALGRGTTARDITTKSQQHYQAKKNPAPAPSSSSHSERARLFMSQPFVSLYGKSLAGHIPLHVPVCVFPRSHTHFPASVTSSTTLRRKKSLINVGHSSKQTHTAEEKWSLEVLLCQFYANHLFISQTKLKLSCWLEALVPHVVSFSFEALTLGRNQGF